MSAALDKIRREPALAAGLVGAVIALLLAFGVDLSNEQTGAIMAFVMAALAIFTRSQVTPTVAVGASEEGDTAGAPLVAGPAASLPNDTEVDVVPAERVYGEDERGDVPTGTLVAIAAVVFIICGIVWLFQAL